jgi:hypothetical protein
MTSEKTPHARCCGWSVLFLSVTVSPLLLPSPARAKQEMDRFSSPDGKLVAVVIHVGKEAGLENYESRVELRTKEGSLVCSNDYSSNDSEHGYGVAKAAWTPDSQFFVYSLQSSGGHSPWHTPIQFYNRQQNKILSLDDALGDSIASPEFSLAEPDEIKVTLYFSKRQMTLRLSELPQAKPQKKAHRRGGLLPTQQISL